MQRLPGKLRVLLGTGSPKTTGKQRNLETRAGIGKRSVSIRFRHSSSVSPSPVRNTLRRTWYAVRSHGPEGLFHTGHAARSTVTDKHACQRRERDTVFAPCAEGQSTCRPTILKPQTKRRKGQEKGTLFSACESTSVTAGTAILRSGNLPARRTSRVTHRGSPAHGFSQPRHARTEEQDRRRRDEKNSGRYQ